MQNQEPRQGQPQQPQQMQGQQLDGERQAAANTYLAEARGAEGRRQQQQLATTATPPTPPRAAATPAATPFGNSPSQGLVRASALSQPAAGVAQRSGGPAAADIEDELDLLLSASSGARQKQAGGVAGGEIAWAKPPIVASFSVSQPLPASKTKQPNVTEAVLRPPIQRVNTSATSSSPRPQATVAGIGSGPAQPEDDMIDSLLGLCGISGKVSSSTSLATGTEYFQI